MSFASATLGDLDNCSIIDSVQSILKDTIELKNKYLTQFNVETSNLVSEKDYIKEVE
jgi:hypothetical protein